MTRTLLEALGTKADTTLKEATALVLRFVAARWGDAGSGPGTIAAEIKKAARAKGISVSLADYLDAIAGRHDMLAAAFRLAARAARGESLEELIASNIIAEKKGTDPR